MISEKLRVAGSTGSFRTGAVVTNVTVWPAGVSAGTLADESGGKKKGASPAVASAAATSKAGSDAAAECRCGAADRRCLLRHQDERDGQLLFLEELGHRVRPDDSIRL